MSKGNKMLISLSWFLNDRNSARSLQLVPDGTGGCGEGHFKCKLGGCVEKRALCDGTDDCGDGTDEENCG